MKCNRVLLHLLSPSLLPPASPSIPSSIVKVITRSAAPSRLGAFRNSLPRLAPCKFQGDNKIGLAGLFWSNPPLSSAVGCVAYLNHSNYSSSERLHGPL